MAVTTLPHGVALHPFTVHADERGTLSEIFRDEWPTGVRPLQWNFVRSAPGVLRGVHLHVHHTDYLIVLEGCATIGLVDLRPGSPTERLATTVDLVGSEPRAIVIPPGVAHGFYFDVPSLHLYAVDHYWSPADELGCRYDDPGLGLRWPATPKLVSERDRALPPLDDLLRQVPRFAGAHGGA